MKQNYLTSLFVGGFLVCAAPALADAPFDLFEDRIVLAEALPLRESEMKNIRGGFMDPTGLIYNFAVNVRTALEGVEVFTRSLMLSPSGANGHLQAVGHSSVFPTGIPEGLNLRLMGGGAGLSVTDASGKHTTVLNQTAAGVPTSIVLNTRNDVNLAQSVDMTLTLSSLHGLASRINASVRAGLFQRTSIRPLGY